MSKSLYRFHQNNKLSQTICTSFKIQEISEQPQIRSKTKLLNNNLIIFKLTWKLSLAENNPLIYKMIYWKTKSIT